jgi:UDP-N-acetylmuramate: L-alanyl-gamma-D-glutamyl-meso-diaminopimelate ligase
MVGNGKRIYFVGIGGVAMGNGAILAKSIGCEVFGSDGKLYAPMDSLLNSNGIAYAEEFNEKNIEEFRPDLVVVGNCIGRGNCEAEWLIDCGKFPLLSLPQFLFENFFIGRHRIVFSGTHGKTTSCAACANYMRQQLAVPVGFFVGGSPIDFPVGAEIGKADAPFAIEGDEYDSAFFDKRSKFVHYAPNTAIIGGIEFDHWDIFRDLVDVERAFNHMVRTVPRSGRIFYNGDCPSAKKIAAVPWVRSHSVGLGAHNEFRIVDLTVKNSGTEWRILHGKGETAVSCSLCGEFNGRNCTMAVLAAHHSIGRALPDRVDLRSFSGVRRRQSLLRNDGKCIVYEDFGHHPSAVREVLSAMRLRHPHCELIACFEPASITSASGVLAADFVGAFSLADRCYWATATRRQANGGDGAAETVVSALRSRGIDAATFGNNGLLLDRLLAIVSAQSNRMPLIVLFSSGAFPVVLPHWKGSGDGSH